jgi:hypothetical protein
VITIVATAAMIATAASAAVAGGGLWGRLTSNRWSLH